MTEIVNLRMARKAKARRDAEETAATNRARFGQTKASKLCALADADRLRRTLDGAKRDD
ncbi:MAG: DUF4169 family protein [Novosphingobium sp.]